MNSSNVDPESRRYLDSHSLDRVFKDMLTCILEDRPKDPILYMISGLKKASEARQAALCTPSPLPISYIHFFHQEKKQGKSDSISEDEGLDLNQLAELSAKMRLQQEQDTAGHQLPPDFISARRQSVSAESYQPDLAAAYSTPKLPSHPKSPGSRDRIELAVMNNLLFRNLDDDQRSRILDAMFERRVSAGHVVIKQGDPGDNFYVIETGRFSVQIESKEVDVLGPGKTFGELALMYNCPRSASIIAMEPGTLWAVDRETFRRVVIDMAYKKRRLYEGFLASVPLLSSLTSIEISRIADALEPIDFISGATIVREGDPGDEFFIIVSGEALVTQKDQQVNVLRTGDYFGELALLNQTPRSATIVASTDVKCISLSASAFKRLLGPLMDILKRNQERYRQYVAQA